MTIGKCKVCGEKANLWHCEKHYVCEICGTKENLCHRDTGLVCDSCHSKIVKERIENFEGDTDYASETICPYCGFEMGDSWELSDNHGKRTCESCENEFEYSRYIEVTYSTNKIS